jgi:transcriptional regulator with XRE-family HTH domain
MAARPTAEPDLDAALLSQILKAIRRRRGLKVAQVAKAMGIATRTYANFEAGRQRISIAKIHLFSQVVGADPYAILVAVDIKSPSFALRCMDHQFMAMLTVLIQDFDARTNDSFARIDPRMLYDAARQFFDGLLVQTQEIDASLERWMLDRSLHESPDPEDPDELDPDDEDGEPKA